MIDSRIFGIEGWIHTEELEFINKCASLVTPDGIIVEIGAWLGKSTMAIATASQDKIFITIDNWKGQKEFIDTTMSLVKTGKLFDMFIENCMMLGFNPIEFESLDKCKPNNMYYISGDSVASASLFPDKSIDMWFDDGDHNMLDEDITSWKHTFKESTMLLGHDHTAQFPNVVNAVKKHIVYYRQCQTIWYKI